MIRNAKGCHAPHSAAGPFFPCFGVEHCRYELFHVRAECRFVGRRRKRQSNFFLVGFASRFKLLSFLDWDFFTSTNEYRQLGSLSRRAP